MEGRFAWSKTSFKLQESIRKLFRAGLLLTVSATVLFLTYDPGSQALTRSRPASEIGQATPEGKPLGPGDMFPIRERIELSTAIQPHISQHLNEQIREAEDRLDRVLTQIGELVSLAAETRRSVAVYAAGNHFATASPLVPIGAATTKTAFAGVPDLRGSLDAVSGLR